MYRQSIRMGIIVLAAISAVSTAGEATLKKLSKEEAAKAAVTRVPAEYPAVARQLKMQGTVELEAVIAEDGSVEDVRILSGNPVLTKAAAQALKKWKFTPATEDGKPVKAVAPLEFSFKL
jgi:periplasmic protein TonB